MHTSHKREDPLVDMGYETRDINFPVLTKTVIGFFVFAIASALIGMVVYWQMNPYSFGRDPAFKANANRHLPPPPNPLLQDNVNSKTDLEQMRLDEEEKLSTTGWANDAHTKVRLPIDRAIELTVEHGLPVPPKAIPAGPAKVSRMTSQPASQQVYHDSTHIPAAGSPFHGEAPLSNSQGETPLPENR